MNNAKQVEALIREWKNAGKDKSYIVWHTALACVSWPYVFGARGEYCSVQNRHRFYRDDHPTIRTKCKGYDSGSCSGCKWYPNAERVRCYDCRGFTSWCLKQVGILLNGAGATSQWNDASNWKAKGKISEGFPANTLVCLFYSKDNKEKTWEHTGFGLNNETVECSSGVQHFTSRKAKWTHWAIPAGLDGEVITTPAAQNPGSKWRATLRRGSKGADVIDLQTMLVKLGYGVGGCGIDGDYGRDTKAAVERFQSDHGLVVDGVAGPMTFDALEKAIAKLADKPAEKTYTVKITGLDLTQAQAIANNYPGAEIIEGSGA